ncbi:MAG TPA: aminotransferase [Opitutae bacterium]|nr:aminotransferase [Opitutae bacterium]
MHTKLFIPGPVDVSQRSYQAMVQGLVSHRSLEFEEIYRTVQSGLQKIFESKDPVFLITSSAWGALEGSLKNTCRKKALCCTSGAFSEKWYEVALANGIAADALKHDWGTPIDPNRVEEALKTGDYDAITIVHSETSTGTYNPVKEIMEVVKQFPEVISLVDTVSSFSGAPTPKDAWGVDVIVTGVQKALALPPGLALASVSNRALERAKAVPHRGYYFDFLELNQKHANNTTVTTPAIALIYALKDKVEEIESEGLKTRFERHARLNKRVHDWVEKQGLSLFPEKKYAAKTLSCIRNTRNIDLPAFNQALKDEFSFCIDGGYGKLKGKTLRISNMGNETEASMQALLDAMDVLIERFA